MTSKNILVFTVLMIFGVNNYIQAEIIHGLEVPTLDVTSIVGKWYLVASTNAEDQDVCTSNTVEEYSNNNFTMYMNRVLKPDTRDNYANSSDKVYSVTIKSVASNTTRNLFNILKNDSDALPGVQCSSELSILAFFGPQYKIYLLFHTEKKAARAINGSDKIVFIFSREKYLPDEFPGAVEGYPFYQPVVHTETKLYGVNPAVCE